MVFFFAKQICQKSSLVMFQWPSIEIVVGSNAHCCLFSTKPICLKSLSSLSCTISVWCSCGLFVRESDWYSDCRWFESAGLFIVIFFTKLICLKSLFK